MFWPTGEAPTSKPKFNYISDPHLYRGDEFHASALRAYLRKFNFTNDPLDIAVRRLLMHVALPRETQQIDRVMDAFAARWGECNDGLFVQQGAYRCSDFNVRDLTIWLHVDHAYILAFSLIMLHTDAFNKSNKNKMTKAAYVKNTRLPGVQPEVLEVCCRLPFATYATFPLSNNKIAY